MYKDYSYEDLRKDARETKSKITALNYKVNGLKVHLSCLNKHMEERDSPISLTMKEVEERLGFKINILT
jgi:hypothetical protein